MAGKCSFNKLWVTNSLYNDWLVCDIDDRHKAKCRVCQKCFSISKMGEAAVKSHMKGAKHAELMTIRQSSNISSLLFKKETSESEKKVELPAEVSKVKVSEALIQKASMDLHVFKNEVLDAEIIWTLRTVKCHNSYKSNENIGNSFKRMFPDSLIASKFTCGERKSSYYAVFGIAPYFKNCMLQELSEKNNYVLLFDETLNAANQKKQMDIHVRFWSSENCVKTYFLTSVFMGHATATDILGHFRSAVLPLKMSKVIQISMDGPNVNWKFYILLQDEVFKEARKLLLNIGSCGLHIVHNSFKYGCKASDWDLHSFLSSLYYLFKDSPARRADYLEVSGEDFFPQKFVGHRWLENVVVGERAVKILPSIQKYVNSVKEGKLVKPQCKSFDTVQSFCNDHLLTIKLHIFISISKLLSPFLQLYQTDRPMIFFLAVDLKKLLESILQRFIKREVMISNNSLLKILKLDVKDTENHVASENIDLGFVAEKQLKQLYSSNKVTDRQVFEIRMSTKLFLINVFSKLIEKSPVTFSVVRNMSCLDPRKMATEKESCRKKIKLVLGALVEARQIPESDCDEIVQQFGDFLQTVVPLKYSHFVSFDHKNENCRIDTFFHDTMNDETYNKLWEFVKMLLLLSHGQASVERGFSVNKKIEVENLKEHSYISQRIICEHINKLGNINDITITKDLRMSVSAARQRYMSYLENQKEINEAQVKNEKRSLEIVEHGELKKKKQRLEKDISVMFKSADEYAEKAENTGNLTLIAKSNSFRRTAKEKQLEVIAIDETLQISAQANN